jgi:hypothetical protein
MVARRTDGVQRVTSARRSLSDDVAARTHRYLLMMGIRTACFLGAVFLPVPVWVRGLLIAGALLLPYLAVVDANSGREPPPAAAVPPVLPPALPGPPADDGLPGQDPGPRGPGPRGP